RGGGRGRESGGRGMSQLDGLAVAIEASSAHIVDAVERGRLVLRLALAVIDIVANSVIALLAVTVHAVLRVHTGLALIGCGVAFSILADSAHLVAVVVGARLGIVSLLLSLSLPLIRTIRIALIRGTKTRERGTTRLALVMGAVSIVAIVARVSGTLGWS
ncbi:hypothetical protein PENTCL1PPCAC_5924, partial [Pristionchus entomophagus]